MNRLKIIFAGTPEFAAVALDALLVATQDIVAVYTQPDRPAGRGRKLAPSPVKKLALENNIPVEQPVNFKDAMTLQTLAAYQADLMIVAAYGLLLPEAVLTTPRLGCMNIHASLLPRWRGAAPIQRAILAGDQQTGVTIMQMDAGLDTGDMLQKKGTAITESDTATSLHDRLAVLGAEAMLETLHTLAEQKLTPEKQDSSLATYAKKLLKDEAWINWRQDATLIHRQIRAFNPWPMAQSLYGDQTVRFHEAELLSKSTIGHAGEILAYDKTGLIIACQSGQLRISKCQLPGAKAMHITDLYNGHPQLFGIGTCFTSEPKQAQ